MEELLRQLTTLVQGLVDDMSVLKQDMQTVKQKLGQLEQRMDKGEKRGASVYGVDLFIFLRQRS